MAVRTEWIIPAPEALMPDRRQFLQRTAVAAALAALARARDTFALELDHMGRVLETSQDFSALRNAYLLGDDVVYLNHASIGTIPGAVHQARMRYLATCETNPWLYMWGPAWQEPREEVRRIAAAYIGCAPDELAFTHNTTEGFNTLAQGLDIGADDEVLFSSLNHPGASIPWQHCAPRRGYTVRSFDFPVREVAGMTAADVVQAYTNQITESTAVLVFPHIDNIVGLRHPVRQLAEAARAMGVRFVAVDGAQSVGMIPVDAASLGVDFYATSPHKWLQAPKGLGLLYVQPSARPSLVPMWVTWGQERWRGTVRVYEDYGTRNLAEVLTLGDAVRFQERLDGVGKERRLQDIRTRFREAVDASPRLAWRSPATWALGSSLYAIEPVGRSAGALFERLYAERGVVYRAFGDPLNTMRISPNLVTTADEIERFLALVA